MTLIEFVNKYIKEKVDFDGAYGYQCVDLFRQYCKDVLNLGHTGSVEGAKDLYLNYESLPKEKEAFCRLSSFQTGPAKAGYIAVWNKTESNKYGHVAIVLQEYANGDLLVFEQNGFSQIGAELKIRNKNNLLGYLVRWE